MRAAAGSARALAADTIGRHHNGIAGSPKAQGLILVSWDARLGAGGVAGTCTALYEAMAALGPPASPPSGVEQQPNQSQTPASLFLASIGPHALRRLTIAAVRNNP